jgi:hypothetical protein
MEKIIKDLEQREGWVNRNTNGLPTEPTTMKVITKDVDGERVYLCKWNPFDKSQYRDIHMPGKGYLGTAKVIEGRYKGIGFHAWAQNNSEFVWYDVVL